MHSIKRLQSIFLYNCLYPCKQTIDASIPPVITERRHFRARLSGSSSESTALFGWYLFISIFSFGFRSNFAHSSNRGRETRSFWLRCNSKSICFSPTRVLTHRFGYQWQAVTSRLPLRNPPWLSQMSQGGNTLPNPVAGLASPP